jgi:hypothetical protein
LNKIISLDIFDKNVTKMAANIPFTSDHDNRDKTSASIQQHHGSVLDILDRLFPDVSSIVHRSGLQALYTSNSVTMFVPEKIVYDRKPVNMSIVDAIQFCRNMTAVRYLDRIALNYYGKFVLKTLATPYDLTIESFPNGLITVNGSTILSSIQCQNGYIHVLQSCIKL